VAYLEEVLRLIRCRSGCSKNVITHLLDGSPVLSWEIYDLSTRERAFLTLGAPNCSKKLHKDFRVGGECLCHLGILDS
jgi:hypothetical protein